MARKQTLIHLHGTGRLSEKTMLQPGEIAVRHGSDAKNSELAILDNTGNLVYIPSIDTVDANIEAAKALALKATSDLAAGAVADNTAAIATLNGNEETAGSVKKAVKDAQDALQGEIDAINTKIGGEFDENATVAAAIADAKAAGTTAQTNLTNFIEKTYTPAMTEVTGDITALEEALGEGFDKDNTVADAIASAKDAGDEAMDALDSFKTDLFNPAVERIKGVEDRMDTAEGDIDNLEKALGTGFGESNTVADAVDAINTKIGGEFDENATVADAIAAAKKAGDDAQDAFDTFKGSEFKTLSENYSAHVEEFTKHVNETDGKDKLHITAEERTSWNEAASALDAFLNGEDVDGAVNTLKEIQVWLDTDGEGAKALSTTLAAHEEDIKDNADSITTINKKWGAEYSESNTVAAAIADAKAAGTTAQTNLTNFVNDTYTPAINGINTTIGTLPSDYTTLVGGIAAAKKAGDDAQTNLTNFIDKTYTPAMAEVTGDIDNLEKALGTGFSESNTVAAAIADAKAAGTTAQTNLTNFVNGDFKQAQDDIDALEGRMDTAEGDINNLEAVVGVPAGEGVVASGIFKIIEENERVTANSFNDLNARLGAAADGETPASGVYADFIAADSALEQKLSKTISDLSGETIKSAVVKLDDSYSINGTVSSNVLTFDFTSLVIDCGTYE